MAQVTSVDRNQSLGEEIANSISHGVGFAGAVTITPFLILAAIPSGAASIVGASIFGLTMMLLYLSSTLYHAFPHNKAKKIFKIFDHAAIFLLIAGTYTPFTLSVLKGAWGWSLFGIVWALAIVGVVMKTIGGAHSGKLSLALYLGMGWIAVVAAKPLWSSLPVAGLQWLAAGGIMYTAGVLFYAYDHRVRYGHFIWHLFVLAGTVCHVVAIMGYAY